MVVGLPLFTKVVTTSPKCSLVMVIASNLCQPSLNHQRVIISSAVASIELEISLTSLRNLIYLSAVSL